jgi:signal transduction histidine kinase
MKAIDRVWTGLGPRLSAIFILLTTLPLAVAGCLAYESSRNMIERDMIGHLTATTTLREAALERWIADGKRRLEELASRPLIREYAGVLATQGPSTSAYRAVHDSMIADHFVPTLKMETGLLELFLLRVTDGLITVSTVEKREGQYRESEPYLLEGKRRTYVKNIYYSLTLEDAAMIIGTPVTDREGHVVAVLAGRVDLAEMSAIMVQGSSLRASEETYLVNKYNFAVTQGRLTTGRALENAIYTDGVKNCLADSERGYGVGLYDDYRGVPVIGVYRWIPERELCILTEVDQVDAFAPVAALRNTMLGIGLAVALAGAVVGVLFGRTITQPLRQVVAGAAEIGRGNLVHRIASSGRDEIGQLAASFDAMAANLQEAQDRLLRSERLAVLGQLAGGVGHDLRNPLGVISNAVYLLRTMLSDCDETVQECLEMISGEVNRANTIISSLLDFARTRTAEKRATAIPALLGQVLERTPAPDGVHVSVDVASDLPAAFIDPVQIGRVLTNLVSNAYQAMPEGGTLVLRAMARPDRGGEIVLSIADSGCGIPAENMGKLFEPLFSTKPKGTGLGLAVCNNLVAANGGRIEAQSDGTPGKGATFTVVLPVKGAAG